MFAGFSLAAKLFFEELLDNNNRDWFAENKPRYEDLVVKPALDFIGDLQRPLAKISPFFLAIPKRSGGSVLRIYRDVRFSKNKLPFKTNLGIHLRHEMGKDTHAPGFYFHISPESVFMGCGIWQPESSALNRIRGHLDEEQQAWKRIKNAKQFRDSFRVDGSSLKRPPKNYEAHHPLIEDLKRKDHFITADLSWQEIGEPEFVDSFIKRVKIGMPYMRFLCDALNLPS